MTKHTHPRQRLAPAGSVVVGLVAGCALTLSLFLLGAELLAATVDSIVAVAIIALLAVLVVGVVTYALRATILTALFGRVSVSGQAFLEATSDAIGNWSTDSALAARSAEAALKEGAALATWLLARRTMVTTVLSLMGTLIALVGTAVLLRQTEIMAGQGRWEQLLWTVHYGAPAARIEAAIQLVSGGYRLSGIQLVGDVRDEGAFVNLSGKLRRWDGTYELEYPVVPAPSKLSAALNPQALFRSLPDSLTRNIDSAHLVGVEVPFLHRDSDLDRFSFQRSIVTLHNSERIPIAVRRSNFDQSLVRLQTGDFRFIDTTFRQSMVSTSFGRVVFEGVVFDGAALSLTWGRDFIADARGRAVVVEYHGFSPVPTESEPAAGFGRCLLGSVVFVGRSGDLPNGLSRSDESIGEFLDDTVSCECQIDRIYFVEEEGARRQTELRIVDGPTHQAAAWLASRNCGLGTD